MSQEGQVIVITTDSVPGRNIKHVLGMVWGSAPLGQGGDARQQAYDDLLQRAASIGANAVIGIGIDSNLAHDAWSTAFGDCAFYGTVVVLD